MPEKMSFWKKLEQSRKLQWGVFVTLMGVVFTLYLVLLQPVETIARKDFQIIENDFSWIFHVESAEYLNNELIITGWAYEKEKESSQKSFDVVLHNIKTNEYILPEVEYRDRVDINSYYSCEYNYLHSGFVGRIQLNEMEKEEQIYEILIRPYDKSVAYKSNAYLMGNKLYSTNPLEYMELDIEDSSELRKIVDNGILEVYRKDVGMYVYQYEGYLYWIADENYFFEEDGSTYVQYQLWTTQNEKLPSHRLENNWLFDNLGFTFEANEVRELCTAKYRVAKAAIPTEYAICKIETGYYVDNQWIWINHFLPYSK